MCSGVVLLNRGEQQHSSLNSAAYSSDYQKSGIYAVRCINCIISLDGPSAGLQSTLPMSPEKMGGRVTSDSGEKLQATLKPQIVTPEYFSKIASGVRTVAAPTFWTPIVHELTSAQWQKWMQDSRITQI